MIDHERTYYIILIEVSSVIIIDVSWPILTPPPSLCTCGHGYSLIILSILCFVPAIIIVHAYMTTKIYYYNIMKGGRSKLASLCMWH